MRSIPSLRLLTALLLALGLSACASAPPQSEPEARAEFFETNDPLEPLNRGIYTFNQGVDTLVVRPATEAYRIFIPQPLRTGVANVLGNLRAPVVFLNDALQGRPDRAEITFSRFLINSTVGVLGVFDVASEWGLPPHTEDFGQTLAIWNGNNNGGPFLMLPLLGPSNLRDTVGFGIDLLVDPFGFLGGGEIISTELQYLRTGLSVLDTREQLIEPLDALRRESLDPYAALRSLYRQRRDAEIANTVSPSVRRFNWEGR